MPLTCKEDKNIQYKEFITLISNYSGQALCVFYLVIRETSVKSAVLSVLDLRTINTLRSTCIFPLVQFYFFLCVKMLLRLYIQWNAQIKSFI